MEYKEIIEKDISSTRTEIEDLIYDQPTTMSKYQIDHFVINDKITDYKILKQILLELGTRYVGIDELKLDTQIEVLELQKMQAEKSNLHKGLDKDILGLKIQKQENKIKQFKKTLRNHIYEIEIMEANFIKLKKFHTDPKALLQDETGEEIYWVNKFIKEAQIDIMTGGRIGKGVLDAIMALPENLQEVIIHQSIAQAANNNGYIAKTENEIISKINESKKVQLMLGTVVGTKTKEIE